MNDRTCIVTRQGGDRAELIRFVADPDGNVVPDLKQKLPGRGCWVTARREKVDEAVRRKLFARALKAKVNASDDLGAQVDGLMASAALGALGLARKAGAVALGAETVEKAVRSGRALCVLHASDAAPDGVRKITQARKAVEYGEGPVIPAFKLFPLADLSLALGGANVVHAAVLAGGAGKAAKKRVVALDDYRGENPLKQDTVAAFAAKDVE